MLCFIAYGDCYWYTKKTLWCKSMEIHSELVFSFKTLFQMLSFAEPTLSWPRFDTAQFYSVEVSHVTRHFVGALACRTSSAYVRHIIYHTAIDISRTTMSWSNHRQPGSIFDSIRYWLPVRRVPTLRWEKSQMAWMVNALESNSAGAQIS